MAYLGAGLVFGNVGTGERGLGVVRLWGQGGVRLGRGLDEEPRRERSFFSISPVKTQCSLDMVSLMTYVLLIFTVFVPESKCCFNSGKPGKG